MTDNARLHFHSLIGSGWTLRSVAAHAGAAPTRVRAWVEGENIPSVERGVLAIALDSLPTRTTPSSATPAGKEADPFVPRIGTTREERARQLANLARWEATQSVNRALSRLDQALKDSARFALSQSTVPSQHRGDRHWYRLLVVSHLAATVAAIGHADDHLTIGADQ